jgi:hypothetical protein
VPEEVTSADDDDQFSVCTGLHTQLIKTDIRVEGRGSTNEALELVAVFSNDLVIALSLAIPPVALAIERIVRHVLNDRQRHRELKLVRRAIKKKKTREALPDLVKVIEAQQVKPWWPWRKDEPPELPSP